METFVPVVPDVQGYSVNIDGVLYRTLRRDANDNLLVAAIPFPCTTLYHNQVTPAIAPPATNLPNIAIKAVSLAAAKSNTGLIYVGSNTLTVINGRILSPGDAIDIAVDNLNRIYLLASIAGQLVSYLAVN